MVVGTIHIKVHTWTLKPREEPHTGAEVDGGHVRNVGEIVARSREVI